MLTICPFIPQGRGVCSKDFRGVLRQDRSDPGSGNLREGVGPFYELNLSNYKRSIVNLKIKGPFSYLETLPKLTHFLDCHFNGTQIQNRISNPNKFVFK